MRLEDEPDVGGMNALLWKPDWEAARMMAPEQHDILSPDVAKVTLLDVLACAWSQLQPWQQPQQSSGQVHRPGEHLHLPLQHGDGRESDMGGSCQQVAEYAGLMVRLGDRVGTPLGGGFAADIWRIHSSID